MRPSPETNKAKRNGRHQFEVIALLDPSSELPRHRELIANPLAKAFDSKVAHHKPQLQCAKSPAKLRTVIHEILDLVSLIAAKIFGNETERIAKHIDTLAIEHAQIERHE